MAKRQLQIIVVYLHFILDLGDLVRLEVIRWSWLG